METDPLIQAVRFIALRGNINPIRCGNGLNAKSELQRALSQIDHEKILSFLLNDRTC